MPYERRGAMKVSSHDVASPLATINSSCQNCHNVDAGQLRERVYAAVAVREVDDPSLEDAVAEAFM